VNRTFVVRIGTVGRAELPRGGRFLAQAKLPFDEPGHPYGQWSVAVEVWSEVADGLLANVAFVSPLAPSTSVRRGTTFDLFWGRREVGSARVEAGPATPGDDRDFLASTSERPHEAWA
jgi:hypothetical protein